MDNDVDIDVVMSLATLILMLMSLTTLMLMLMSLTNDHVDVVDHFDVDVDVVVDVVDHVDGVNWTVAPYLRPLSELRPGFLTVLWEICFLSIRIFFFMVTANCVSLVTKPILILYSLLCLRRIIRLECKQS